MSHGSGGPGRARNQIRQGVRRLFRLAVRRREHLTADVEDELRLHLDLRTEQFARRGLSPGAARAAAEQMFGSIDDARTTLNNVAQQREKRMHLREQWDALEQDTRYALRSLRRAPAFTLVTLLTLMLGIGATTAVFSVIDVALFRGLPYPNAAQLVFVSDQQNATTPMSYPEYLEWRSSNHVFSDLGTYFNTSLSLTGAGEPEVLHGARISTSLLKTLGVDPALGRVFRDGEEPPGTERVIMLGHAFWTRRFNADSAIVGRVLTLNGNPFTVVGVLPALETGMLPTDLASGRTLDFWMPLRLTVESAPAGLHFLSVVGRLRDGVDLAAGQRTIARLSADLARTNVAHHAAILSSLSSRVLGESKILLLLVLGAVTAVLLIASVNVANLLLVRGSIRAREMAIRGALGAGQRRIARQVLTESIMLALMGGALGIVVAYAGLAILRNAATSGLLGEALPRISAATVDWRIFGFAAALSLLTGLAFGLLPALRTSRLAVAPILRGSGRGVAGARDRTRSALVVAEVSLSFVLLIGAVLLFKSFANVLGVNKGFESSNVLAFSLELPRLRYAGAAQQTQFFNDVLARTRALPGIESAALTAELPLSGNTNGGVTIVGRTFPPNGEPVADKRIVSGDYFRTLRVPLLQGRTFDAHDVAGSSQVAIINQSFARKYFANEDPIGREIDFGWDTQGTQRIVGVTGDLREAELHQPSSPTVYVAFGQRTSDPSMTVVAKTHGDPLNFVAAVRGIVKSVDPNQPISRIRTLEDIVSQRMTGRRIALSFAGLFALIALVLASIGLYAVISYSVAQRVQEIGVRRALGATGSGVVRLILSQSLLLVLVGTAVGAGIALIVGQYLQTLLYGIKSSDVTTFATVATLLLATAVLAAVVPALRAAQVDPLQALRAE